MKAFLILLTTIVTFAQNSSPEDNLPPDINKTIEGFVAGQIQSLLKEKCSQVSGSDAAYNEAEEAGTKAAECIQNTIGDEIEPTGNLDSVLNKYCGRRIEAMTCVEKFTNALELCLTDEEKGQKIMLVNMAKSLLEFICHENGNQIALFIAEEGPLCYLFKKEALEVCFNKTMSKYTNGELPLIENLLTLVIKEEHCEDINKLEVCIVKELETCEKKTPANLVEALFKFVMEETPCKNPMNTKNNAVVNSMSIMLMTLSIALARLLQIHKP